MLRPESRSPASVTRKPDLTAFAKASAVRRSVRAEAEGPAYALNMFLITNVTFAGRSASRRMYHGNQYSP